MTAQNATRITYRYGIDQKGQQLAAAGLLKLSGWIVCWPKTDLLIRLRLDSPALYECQSGLARPDIGSTFTGDPSAETSGFAIETHLAAGFHIATLEYCPVGESTWTPFHTLSINSELSPLLAQLESSQPPEIPGAAWRISGWCLHPQFEIESITVQTGHYQATLQYHAKRPEIAEEFPLFPGALNSGFSGHLNLDAGPTSLMLTARLTNGSVLRSALSPNRDLLNAPQPDHRGRAVRIKLPESTEPEVSIIIPIYNQLELTLTCLESLVRHAGPTRFEVIVIDDKSATNIPEILGLVSGLKILSNEANQGFVLNCNRGATEAHGEYVLFLNNDTEVTAGWLEAMLKVFAMRPNAGAVGAKLLYPDGRLQEAGGIIGEEGFGWNYGRGDDPNRPEYNYLRQVDYCSGACLLVPRDLFLQLGGFDTRFQPAYYEDTDLAFAIRAAGKEVYYQPAAQIVHFEGASSGTDLRQGVKRHQVINREKFAAKWAEVLPHYNADPSMIEVARDRHASCNILVIDACALTPDMDAGSLRMFNLLKILVGLGSKVTFAAENLQIHEPFTSVLRQTGIEYLEAPAIGSLEAYVELHAFAFDIIILSRKQVALRFIDTIRRCAPAARVVFDTVDLMFLRLSRQAEVEKSDELHQTAVASRLVEFELCTKSDLVFVVSPEEARTLGSGIATEKIAVVPLIHETIPAPEPFARRQGVLFVGGYQHPPNLDAIEYFLDEIFPLLSTRLPELEVHVVGSNTPARLRQRASKKVIIHGYVSDLDPILNHVRISIAPLRFGAGVKGKVNQSMAHGVPVVATSMATEGMYLVDGQNVLVGDTPQTFADAIFRIYSDADLWQKISTEGLKNIERYFSFGAVEKLLVSALGAEILSRKGLERPLARRPAAPYTLGTKLLFGQTGNLKNYAREGWALPELGSCWIVGGKASLVFYLPAGSKPGRVSVVVFPYLASDSLPQQRLRLMVNSRAVPGEMLVRGRAEPKEFSWDLDPEQTLSGHMTLTFICPDATAPLQLGQSLDERKLSFAFLELTITSQTE